MYAATLVDNPHDLASEFIGGAHINKFKDAKTGKNLSDHYLVNSLSDKGKDFAWTREVYKNTSGYIHLSDKHFFNSLVSHEGDGTVSFLVGAEDTSVTVGDR